jgi:aminoglycoside phosphotransferase (APT) family kinase protein
MSTKEHMNAVLRSLQRDVMPAVLTDDRAKTALTATIDIISRMMTNSDSTRRVPQEPAVIKSLKSASAYESVALIPDDYLTDYPFYYFGGRELLLALDQRILDGQDAGKTLTYDELQSVVQWEARCLQEVNKDWAALLKFDDVNAAHSLAIDRDALEAYFRARYTDCPDIAITGFKQLAGGRSKQTALFTLVGCGHLPEELVVRRDHPVGVADTTVIAEFPLQTLLFDRGVALPQPHFVEPDKGAIGGAFLVASQARGTCAGGLFEPPAEPGISRGLASAVAHLHRQPVGQFLALGPRFQVPSIDGYQKSLHSFASIWETTSPPVSAAMRIAIQWLGEHISLVEGHSSLVHRDLGFQNVLSNNGEFVALLDWEFANIGNPAEDLGYLRDSLVDVGLWEDWFSTYKNAGGIDISAEQIDFFAIWSNVRLVSLIAYARHLINSGATEDVQFACSSVVDLYRTLYRLARNLERVLN